MMLIRLHVDNFGRLQNFDLELSDGLNIIHEENGWGKSTLAVFIKAMLYGLPASSKRSLDENERKKYTPWQGGSYGGSLEFACDKGKFRVERTFAPKESGDTFSLFDLSTNKPSSAFSKDLGIELFGIDADGFERSAYLSQRDCAEKCDSGSISARLTGLLSDVDDIDTYDQALSLLEKRRKFYTLMGNRGAVADAEQALREIEGEIERCAEIAQSAQQTDSQLKELHQKIASLEAVAQSTREELKQASLQRERAAHLERKAKALDELALLGKQKKDIESRFVGAIPTNEECKEARQLYDRINDAHAKRRAIPSQISAAPELERLKKTFPSGFPTQQAMEQLEEKNQRLRNLRARREALREHLQGDPSDVRFASGVPSPEQINTTFDGLRFSEKLEKEIAQLQNSQSAQVPPRASGRFLAILLLLLGIALPCLAILPTLAFAIWYLAIAGGAAILMGIILLVSDSQKKKALLRDTQAIEKQIADKTALRTKQIAELRAFLAHYGTEYVQDVSAALSELNMLATQYRASYRQRRRFEEENEQLQRQLGELCAAMQMELSQYLGSITQKSDYQVELDILRREKDQLARLEAEERKRAIDYATAERECTKLQNELLPFLRCYDPESRLRAGECLNAITDACAEYRRIVRDHAQKDSDLRAFLKEKQLESAEASVTVRDHDTLMRLSEKQQQDLNALMEQQGLVKTRLERLLTEADRLTELEAEKARRIAKLKEYQANSKTIASTAKFLEEAKSALSTRYLGDMQESFSRMLELVTEDGDKEAALDTSFEVRLRQGGKTHTMESFSKGWQDIVRFCLHLSLSDALYPEGEKPLLLLDDPFVNLDERRLCAARNLLNSLAKERQIVYMVCHKERA